MARGSEEAVMAGRDRRKVSERGVERPGARVAWQRRSRAAVALAAVTGLLTLVVAAAGCLGQVRGSGQAVTRTYDFTGFTRLQTDHGFNLTVERGDQFSVSVSVDDNLVEDYLEVEMEGDTLRIGLTSRRTYAGVTAVATVTLPALEGVEASGAASVEASGFASGDPLSVELSGASSLTLAGVSAGDVTVEASGASRTAGELEAQALAGGVSGASAVELRGSAGSVRLGASGGSRLELSALEAGDADLDLSGGSLAQVSVTGTLDADLSGGSRLVYTGSPRLGDVTTSGGSVVEPAGE